MKPLFSLVWKLPESRLNKAEIGKCLDFRFTKGFVMKYVAPAAVLVGEMPGIPCCSTNYHT